MSSSARWVTRHETKNEWPPESSTAPIRASGEPICASSAMSPASTPSISSSGIAGNRMPHHSTAESAPFAESVFQRPAAGYYISNCFTFSLDAYARERREFTSSSTQKRLSEPARTDVQGPCGPGWRRDRMAPRGAGLAQLSSRPGADDGRNARVLHLGGVCCGRDRRVHHGRGYIPRSRDAGDQAPLHSRLLDLRAALAGLHLLRKLCVQLGSPSRRSRLQPKWRAGFG